MHVHNGMLAAWLCIAILCTAAISTALTWYITRRRMTRLCKSKHQQIAPQAAPAREFNLWRPQPDEFQIFEHQLLNNRAVGYVKERVHSLRFYIDRLVAQGTWNETSCAEDDYEAMAKSVCQQHDYPWNEDSQLFKALPQPHNTRTCGFLLASLVCRILTRSIMPDSSPDWSLLSPEYNRLAQIAGQKSFDPFKLWAWEKARVYFFSTFFADTLLCDNQLIELAREPPNIDATNKLKVLIADLLSCWMDLDESAISTLDRCCGITSRMGLAIHQDLGPWGWSFEHVGPAGEDFNKPLDNIDISYATEYGGLWPDDTKSALSSSRVIPEIHRIPEDETVIFPALIAEGNESGRRFPSPIVVISAEVLSSAEAL